LPPKIAADDNNEYQSVSDTTNNEIQKIIASKKIPEIKMVLGELYLDTSDLCALLNYSPRAIQNLRNKGLLPYTIIGNKYFYKASDLKEIAGKNYHPLK